MKKNIAIIILSCVIALLISGIITITVVMNNQNKKLTENNDQIILTLKTKYDTTLTERDQKIKELENKKPVIKTVTITKEVLVNMSDTSKDETIIDQQNSINNLYVALEDCFQQINSDTILIDQLKSDYDIAVKNYEKTNNALKNIRYPTWGFEISETVTFNSGYNFNSISSVVFKKYFLQSRFYIGAGGSFNIEKNILDMNSSWNYGGGAVAVIGVNF